MPNSLTGFGLGGIFLCFITLPLANPKLRTQLSHCFSYSLCTHILFLHVGHFPLKNTHHSPMATDMATLPLFPRLPTPRRRAFNNHKLPLTFSLRQSLSFPPLLRTNFNSKGTITCAYVTGPASDPIVSEPDTNIDDSDSPSEKVHSPPNLITWGLLWSLLLKHKLKLVLSVLTLVGCTTCTLSMPVFSGTTRLFCSAVKLIVVLIIF